MRKVVDGMGDCTQRLMELLPLETRRIIAEAYEETHLEREDRILALTSTTHQPKIVAKPAVARQKWTFRDKPATEAIASSSVADGTNLPPRRPVKQCASFLDDLLDAGVDDALLPLDAQVDIVADSEPEDLREDFRRPPLSL